LTDIPGKKMLAVKVVKTKNGKIQIGEKKKGRHCVKVGGEEEGRNQR